jgi:hypothetical protein
MWSGLPLALQIQMMFWGRSLASSTHKRKERALYFLKLIYTAGMGTTIVYLEVRIGSSYRKITTNPGVLV